MRIPQEGELREHLCAEYVLGTLRGRARRRFEHWLAVDAGMRRAVSEWQDRLSPLACIAPEQKPPERLWRAIEAATIAREPRASITAQAGTSASWFERMFGSLALWRGLALAALLAIPLSVYLARVGQPGLQREGQAYVAVLDDDAQRPAMVVRVDASRHTIHLRSLVSSGPPAPGVFELWAVPRQGNPRSLGLIPAGASDMPLPAPALLADAALLAVSVEPPGGSKNPAGPSGPIVFKGLLFGA
jgi:anti-sigma-K factor RskA